MKPLNNIFNNKNLFMNINKINNRSFGKTIVFGAIGGFVAGLVMLPFMMLTGIMAGMPADAMPTAIGLLFGSNMSAAPIVGFSMHILTSILIGIIFGAVTGKASKLMLTRFSKGIAEGLITGMIAFAVLFIPISNAAMPPILMKMASQMNPDMNQLQIMDMLQQKMPMMFGIGILEHLVYGAALGSVVFVLITRFIMKREQETASKELR
jgi:hypothetical protein